MPENKGQNPSKQAEPAAQADQNKHAERAEQNKHAEQAELDNQAEQNEQDMELFTEAKLSYHNIPVPGDLDKHIRLGMEKGKRVSRSRFSRRSLIGIAASLLLTVSLITSIKVSPAFAAYLSNIPGLDYVVQLINYDKGLSSAVENDFIQQVGVSDEHEGIVFTVDSVIIDESSMVLFYTLENKGDHRFVNISDIDVLSETGEHLVASIYHNSFVDKDMNENKQLHEKVTINFGDETVIPENITIEIKLQEAKQSWEEFQISAGDSQPSPQTQEREQQLASTWRVSFPIDKSKFADLKQLYELDQTVSIEGQKIKFQSVTIYPTRIAVAIEYDPANTKQILGFDDLVLVNEQGEEWARINGVIASRIDENHEILYFQSNYFTNPESLYLQGSSIRAIDKNKTELQIDLDKEELINPPDDIITLKSITKENDSLQLAFLLQGDPQKDADHAYAIFDHTFKDAEGNLYSYREAGFGLVESTTLLSGEQQDGTPSGLNSPERYTQETILHLPADQAYKNPLTFTISDYPSRINGEFKIKIK